MNAVIKDENSRKGLSAGFSSRRRVFRNCSGLRFVPPWPWACCYTWSTTWGAQMPLRSAKGPCPEAGDQCSCRCWSRGYPLKPQLHRGCEGGQHERLPNQQPCGMAGKRGERFAAFNAEILAFERAAGRLRHSPAAEVRSPTPERGTPARWERRTSPARPTGNGSAMSLPLPPECWPLQLDDVVVLIEGVAFIETKEEAARLVAEGRLDTPSGTPMTATTT